RVLISIYKTP
ncbi:MMPL family protein, partial [Vibrio parahaemolyticus V-223/04]